MWQGWTAVPAQSVRGLDVHGPDEPGPGVPWLSVQGLQVVVIHLAKISGCVRAGQLSERCTCW